VKFITYGEEEAHAAKLRVGLAKLGPNFVAEVCWWCNGTGRHNYEHCDVCGKSKFYGTALGLLINNEPAPESVVNQVIVAADG